MTFLDLDRRSSSRVLSRSTYLSVVRAGLKAGNYRFAREAAIAWLATFPGDLWMSLCYGQALVGEERLTQALPILQGLCMVDPEYQEAACELYKLQEILVRRNLVEPVGEAASTINLENTALNRKIVFAPGQAIDAYYYVLTGAAEDEKKLPDWATDLRLARWYLEQKQFAQAEQMIRQVLSLQVMHPLIAVTHLHYLAQNQAIHNLEIRQKSAARYTKAWPDSLVCSLYHADWQLENDDSTQAVALLHQAAARDVGGQVPRRIWGDSHPYLPLWPENLQLNFSQSIPADVAAILGWNRLPSQVDGQPGETAAEMIQPLPWENDASFLNQPEVKDTGNLSDLVGALQLPELEGEQQVDPAFMQESRLTDITPQPNLVPGRDPGDAIKQQIESADQQEPAKQVNQDAEQMVWDDPKATAEDLLPMKQVLDKMAKRLKLPGVTQQDGRFPVYVLLSLRKNLDNVYGEQVTPIVIGEMEKLAVAVQQRKRWSARVFLPDDPETLANLEMKPIESSTAWNIKLALTDLDQALSKRGEMIGALLIVGGPDVVPFHALPNPVDDQDDDVPSDNPYATRDENYFMPEWPVGRIPGGEGSDPSLLLAVLRRLAAYHLKYRPKQPWYRNFLSWFFQDGVSKKSSFGYTAAVWRNAAENVFRPIGEPKKLNSSPPLGLAGLGQEFSSRNGNAANIPTLRGSLAYFNLHGMEDAAEWYGQRDPLDPQDGPDYPVALRPQDIAVNGRFRKKNPQVVFSEACYGLHIFGRGIDQAISLKFLEAGSLAVMGSTCMSYGSIDAPLVAADLLGYAFWKYFKDGLPAGEALRQAKIHLAKVMNSRQGYLDGEDQKTIISFVLYGDPLAARETYLTGHKSIWRNTRSVPQVMTVCDRSTESGADQEIPAEVMQSVRQVVSQYLPGMANAQMAYSIQRKAGEGQGHSCPTSEMDKKRTDSDQTGEPVRSKSSGNAEKEDESAVRRLVTLSKQIPNSHGVHAQVARLTLDENGKLVKLVVSR